MLFSRKGFSKKNPPKYACKQRRGGYAGRQYTAFPEIVKNLSAAAHAPPPCRAGRPAGRSMTVTVVPSQRFDSTVMSPPCARVISQA